MSDAMEAKRNVAAMEIDSKSTADRLSQPAGMQDGSQTGVVEKKKEKQKFTLSLKVFRYATALDKFLLAVAVLMNCASGVAMPLFMLYFGDMINELGNPSPSGLNIDTYAMLLAIIGAGTFITGGVGTAAIEFAAERQIREMRHRYLSAVMRQEMGWFDTFDSGTLASRLNQNCISIRDGIGTKLGQLFMFCSMFIGGYIVGFIRGWKMALVLSAAFPVIAASGFFMMYMLSSAEGQSKKAYSNAGAVAEESIGSIRTVAAFGAEGKAVDRYDQHLAESAAFGVRGGIASGFGMGTTFCVVFLVYSLGFWYGGRLVAGDVEAGCTEGCFRGGDALAVFFAIIIAAFSLGQAGPPLTSFVKAGASVEDLMQLIDRQSLIDPAIQTGKRDVPLKGDIVFKNVRFAYPTRQEKPVFAGIDLHIPAGKTVALVGASGCGKSTAIQLIQRFYDPAEGEILIDGTDLRDFNLSWIRDQMSLVSQEPRLFARSIFENIRDGRADATVAEVEQAAKNSNAFDFIVGLPDGFDTYVGESGSQLSGGQKQRIAIARAMLRDPLVLILDEATSALDNESERIVQNTLDELIAKRQRTTVVIAHRLTTVRKADKIIVLDNSDGRGARVAEEGDHDSLMAMPNGIYKALVEAQRLQGDVELASRKVSRDLSGRSRLHSDTHSVDTEDRLARLLRKHSTRSDAFRNSLVETQTPAKEHLSKDAGQKEKPKPPSYWRVMRLLRPHLAKVSFGVLGAILAGLAFPAFTIIYAEFIGVYFLPDPNDVRDESSFWAVMFLALAGFALIAFTLQRTFMEWAGQLLVKELRSVTFSHMVHQDMAFFDDPGHNTGALSEILSSDVLLVKGWSGDNISIIIQNATTLAAALVIAFLAHAKLAAVSLAGFMVMAPAVLLETRFLQGNEKTITEGAETAGYVINETIVNIRIVTAYNLQKRMLAAYDVVINADFERGRKNAYMAGFFFGISQFIQFGAQALSLWYGSVLMRNGEIRSISAMMRATFALMMAAWGIGQTTVFMTDISKAKEAGARVYEVIDRIPPIDARSSIGKEVRHEELTGRITLQAVNFRYPQRQDVPIFRDLSFEVQPGQTVALVGASGCGKSTVIQLLERFYDVEGGVERDPRGGILKLDDIDVRDATVKSLRSVLGLVSQEPILFNTTIEENIRYGHPTASSEEIIAAAKMANAHDFISQFPAGYQTVVGKFGGQLSGGQKQRIAIARAMIRNPKVLLLDEATSALDAESEKVVQAALDRLLAESRRTTIVIAHRLSTIQNSDVIIVLANPEKMGSEVAEIGTHEELMRIPDGVYRGLVNVAAAAEKKR